MSEIKTLENKDKIVLSVKNLQTKFHVGKGLVHAVNDVSFDLKCESTLGIVGESGCGKSVTALSIMQLLPDTGFISAGSIIYRDRSGKEYDITKLRRNGSDIRRIRGKDIAVIFQDPMASLNPVYKVGDQIMENLLEHEKMNKKAARERVVDVLTELGIPDPEKRFDNYPHEFSGGMRQRVMIAIAMICNPSILIADEPTTALDVTIQAQILELMKETQKKLGISIILITHNMGIIAETCDEVAVMYMGKIVEFGGLEQIFNNPLHPYTQSLLMSVPVLGISKNSELVSIKGITPDASEEFAGCAFEPRCDHVRKACKEIPPNRIVYDDGHQVQCWLYS